MNESRMVGPVRRALNRGVVAMAQAATRTALASAYRRMGRRHVIRRIHDYRMLLDLHDPGLSRALMLFRARELDQKVILEQIVKPGMRIFDIGGNIGYYPLLELSLLGRSGERIAGELIAIEPVPQNVVLLKRNLQLNGYAEVPVIEAAVSNVPSVKSFHLSNHSNLGTFHLDGVDSAMMTGRSIEVETVTVPLLAERFGPPDLLRMDVEGHEVEVIAGMLEDIARGAYAPTIVFEPHIDRYDSHHDMAGLLRKLFELGYRVPLLSSGSEVDSERFMRMGYEAGPPIATDAVYRRLFSDIGEEDAIDMICHTGVVRTAVLSRDPARRAATAG